MAGSRPASARDGSVVRAGGGVVWRRRHGEVEVLLVHRPRYDDWSIPKGKAEPGESDEDCALREVEEETGLRCELGAELGATEYVDRKGRDKVVRYWAMRPVSGAFEPGDEVDEIAWVAPEAALRRLSYAHDAAIVRAFAAHADRTG